MNVSKYKKRKLLVAAILCGLCLAWLIDVSHQLVVANQLKRMGAQITIRCGNVTDVAFTPQSQNVSDDDMSLLDNLRHLDWLHLQYTRVGFGGLSAVAKKHPGLRIISVRDDQLTRGEERELTRVCPELTVERLIIASDGRRIVKGFE